MCNNFFIEWQFARIAIKYRLLVYVANGAYCGV